MDKVNASDSVSASDSGVDVSLLEEINRQAAVILSTPLITRRNRDDPDDPSPTITNSTEASSVRPYGSFDLNLSHFENTTTSLSSSPQLAASEPPRSPPIADVTVFTEPPNSSHLGILLLTNARRKLQLEEERIEFEKEKQREKEKRKSKKLFIRLSKRVREKTFGNGMVDITTSASDSALRKINENEVVTGQPLFFGQHRNASTDSGLIPSSAEDREETIEEKLLRLEHELNESRRHVAASDAECQQLRKVQKSLDNEVQDLTETLFQQAYHIADEAEAKRRQAEKLLAEALLKVDLLQAEVKALKDIVKTPAKRAFKFGHKKSDSPVYSLTPKSKSSLSTPVVSSLKSSKSEQNIEQEGPEVDPIYFTEFKEWLVATNHDNDTPFMKRVLSEDVQPCLTFVNENLAAEILEAIKQNMLEMEPILGENVRKCELTQIEKVCSYRLRTDSDKAWVFISLQARNRITAVCDIFTYLRYLRHGIVKALPHDAYQEIASMRKNLHLARFGFEFITKMNGTGLTSPDDFA